MKKKTVLSVMAVAILFAVSLFFVGGTYARYASEFTGNATVGVAKWAVALSKGGTAKNINLELTADTKDTVVEGKIAPGVNATGDIEINLNGTETAVEVIADVDEEAVTTAIEKLVPGGVTNSDIKISKVFSVDGSTIQAGTGNGDTDSPYVISLPDGAAFGETDKVKVTVTVTWTNSDEHNADHTKIGESESGELKLEVPVTLKVQQHIAS